MCNDTITLNRETNTTDGASQTSNTGAREEGLGYCFFTLSFFFQLLLVYQQANCCYITSFYFWIFLAGR